MNQRTAIHVTGQPRRSTIALAAITPSKLFVAGSVSSHLFTDVDHNTTKSLVCKESGSSRLDAGVFAHQPVADSARASDAMNGMKPGQGYMKSSTRQIGHTTMLASPTLWHPAHFGQMRSNQAGTLWPARN
jgi:hypothetical protein